MLGSRDRPEAEIGEVFQFRSGVRSGVMTTGRMPTFLVVGAARSGTTALYAHLARHPEIFMSPMKEPRYFLHAAKEGAHDRVAVDTTIATVTDLESYRQLFAAATTEKALGEASVAYLYAPGCAEAIKRHVPEARIVVVLRHPVERAYSHYLFAVREGFEPIADFEAALDAEPERIRDGRTPAVHYAARGRYHEQLLRYYDTFDADRIRVHLYDDFVRTPVTVVQDLYRFLGVDPSFAPDLTIRVNTSGVPSSRTLYAAFSKVVKAARRRAVASRWAGRLLHGALTARLSARMNSVLLARPPEMTERARERLRAYYRDEIVALERLLGRDLSAWKT